MRQRPRLLIPTRSALAAAADINVDDDCAAGEFLMLLGIIPSIMGVRQVTRMIVLVAPLASASSNT